MFSLVMTIISLIAASGFVVLLLEAITVWRIIMFVVAMCAACCWFTNWVVNK